MPNTALLRAAEIAHARDLAHAIHDAIPTGTPDHIATCAAITYLCAYAEVTGSAAETAALMHAAADELVKPGARFGQTSH